MKRRSYSIQSAMVLAFSLITLGVISTALLVAYKVTMDEVRSVSIDYVKELVSQVNGEIDRYVLNTEDVAEVIRANSAVQKWINEGNATGNAQKLVLEDNVQNQMSGIVNIRKDIANIAIFAEPDRVVFDTRGKELNPYVDYKKKDWYIESKEKGKTFISSSHVQNIVESYYEWVVTMSMPIGRQSAILMVDLNYSLINNLCQSINMGDRGYLYVLDKQGNIIFHPQQQLIYSQIKDEYVSDKLGKSFTDTVRTDQGTKIYISDYSSLTGWTIVGVAYQDEIINNRGNIVSLYFVVFALFLTIAILLSALICSAIAKPLKRLIKVMDEIQSGSLDTSVDITSPKEVAQLSCAFNSMTSRLSNMIRQRENDLEIRRQSEIKALQAQINPHFLYNTLDSIIWMAENDMSEEVVEMTAALAKLFRSSISESRELVPLEVEIANVRSYLTIQQMRYKEKLQFNIDIPVEISGYRLPKLLLQPLVENALYHGVKMRKNGGTINVSARYLSDCFIIEVSDNGVGMSEEKVLNVLALEPHEGGLGIGVKNVHERIKLTFGEKYGLQYESTLDVGTTVRVILPGNEEAENEE